MTFSNDVLIEIFLSGTKLFIGILTSLFLSYQILFFTSFDIFPLFFSSE